MTITRRIEIGRHRAWFVQSGQLGIGPSVTIPIDQIAAMNSEDIGEAVKNLIPEARKVLAIETAEWIDTGRAHEDELEEFIALAAPFEREDDTITRVLKLARATLGQIRDRQAAQRRRDKLRRDIRPVYFELFVKIGQRDGFRCKQCGAVNDLTIDHVTALISGGVNDLENLQLLCRRCNGEKSDRAVPGEVL